MAFFSKVFAQVIQWVISHSVTLIIEWLRKKKTEKEESDKISNEVKEIEVLRAEIIAYKKRGEPVPKELEDKFRAAMSRLNYEL